MIRSLSLLICFAAFAVSPTFALGQAEEKAHATEAAHADEVKAESGDAPHADDHAKDDAHGDDAHADGHGDGHHDEYGAKDANRDPAEIRKDLAIFTFLVFCGLMALLTKFAWGPITDALDNRESKIRQDIADTESAKVKSEKLVAEHEAKLAEVNEEVKEIIAEARRDAETTKTDILASANSEAEAAKQRADADINHAKDVALKELFDSMSDRVSGATEHVLGRSVKDADHDRLIEEALAQFAEGASNKS